MIESISLYTVGDEEFKRYIKELGFSYEDVKDKGILINDVRKYVTDDESKDFGKEMIIPKYNFKKGDKIQIYESSIEEGKTYGIEVAYVTDKKPFGFDDKYYTARLVISDELFDTLFESSSHRYMVISSPNADKLQDEIDELLKDYEYSLTNLDEQVRMTKSFYTLIAIFLYGFITVIALIGITNIFNTVTTNMELRKREFAMLKSIGMTNKEFNRMIRLESFFYGTRSLIVGIPIGCLLSYGIYYVLTNGEPNGLYYELPYGAIIISILAVLILISVIMKYSINKINKQNTIETIRNENI